MAQSNGVLLHIEGLCVSYGHVSALRDVDLVVAEGELVALIGANGAGKSTLVNTILGIVRPNSGTIHFRERDISRLATDRIVAEGIALVPEGRGVVHGMSVLENLLLGGYHSRRRLDENLERVFIQFPLLKERRNQLAGSLSGGELQTLAIGRALMAEPTLLILDEPTLGLSPVAGGELFDAIDLLVRQGQTFLLSDQNATKALGSADRAYVFEVGQVTMTGDASELSKDPRVKQAYLGISRREMELT